MIDTSFLILTFLLVALDFLLNESRFPVKKECSGS